MPSEISAGEPKAKNHADVVGKTPPTRRRYFQMFDAFAVKNIPIHEIAKSFGVSKQTVYTALEWVKVNTPDIADTTQLVSAIRSKQKNLQEWKEDRAAIRDILRRQRQDKLSDEEKKLRYTYRMLKEVDDLIASEEERMYTLIGIIEKNVLKIQGDKDNPLSVSVPGIMALISKAKSSLENGAAIPSQPAEPPATPSGG